MKDDFLNKGEISKNGFWPKTGSIYGLVSRPQRGAVESFTDHFDTNNDSGSSIFCLSAQKLLSYTPTCPYAPKLGNIILLPNDRIFRALSDGTYRIFSVLDLKNRDLNVMLFINYE